MNGKYFTNIGFVVVTGGGVTLIVVVGLVVVTGGKYVGFGMSTIFFVITGGGFDVVTGGKYVGFGMSTTFFAITGEGFVGRTKRTSGAGYLYPSLSSFFSTNIFGRVVVGLKLS